MENTGTTLSEIIVALRNHALANYEQDGWDYLVETFDDAELAEEIRGATSLDEAIAKISPLLRRLDDRRQDIEATAW